MMTKDEALKMAIEALERYGDAYGGTDGDFEALKACEEALEQEACKHGVDDGCCKECYMEQTQTAQEPVAFCKHGVPKGVCTLGEKDCNPAPSWQGLSDDEIWNNFFKAMGAEGGYTGHKFARIIEQALKEKNYE